MEVNVVRDLTVLDFPNICRVCLWKGELKLFENEPVLELFKAITNIHVDFESLPKNVCIECIGKLENISNFINTSKLNDLCLRQILQKNKDNLEDSYVENEPQLEIVDDDEEFERVIKVNVKDENKVQFENDKINEVTNIKKVIIPDSTEKKVGNEAMTCSVCNTIFSTKKDLIEHTKKNPDCKFGGRYECQHCGRKFLVKYKMKDHMKSHSNEKPYECKVCGKKFKVAYNVTRHDNIAHKGIKPYKCKECGKEFARQERLTNHERVHMEKRPYICEECGQTFRTHQGYCVHRKIHSSNRFMEHASNREYKYQCYVCHKNYSTKTVLQTHLMKHRGEKKFLCNVCGRHFYLKSSLDLHYRIHTGEKPFVCKTCNKSFRSKSAYKVHSLTHTGQRYYQCDICSKTFVQSSHLRRHSMVHTGEKPYSCSYCGKQFTQNNNLKAHLRIHTGETPYSCSICHKTFHDSSGMKKHTMMHLRG